MAGKDFSVDDIINEYSSKTAPRKDSERDGSFDALLERIDRRKEEDIGKTLGLKTEVIEDVLEIGDNKYAFTPPDEENVSEG